MPLSPALARELERVPRRGLWIVSRLDGDMLTYAGALDRFPFTLPYQILGEEIVSLARVPTCRRPGC